jgi:hypothetical protein
MAREEIEIEIGPDGKVSVRTIGIKGPRCVEVAEALARIVGEEQSRQMTSEFYENEIHQQQHLNVHRRNR